MIGTPALGPTNLTGTKPTVTQNTKTMIATLRTNAEMFSTIAHGRTDTTRLVTGMIVLIGRIVMRLMAVRRRRNMRLEMSSMIVIIGSIDIMRRIRGPGGRIDRIEMRRMEGQGGGRMSAITMAMDSEDCMIGSV